MRLESGPASTDRNWHLARALIFVGFAGYFVYDGAIGYPKAIRSEAEAQLAAEPFNKKISYDALSDRAMNDVAAQLTKDSPRTRSEVIKSLGEPTLSLPPESGSRARSEYYLTRYGTVKFVTEGYRITEKPILKLWKGQMPNGFDKAKVQQQFYWAIIPFALGLPFVYWLIRAVTLRVVLDDEGMTYAGKRIPFADMVSLRDYSPKGWIDLYHREAGRERKLRLDNQKVQKFDEIVDAICQAKGFPTLVRESAARKAREDDETPTTPDEPPAKD